MINLTKNSKFFNFAVAIALLIFLGSCATVFKGKYEDVDFTTDPQGAKVFVNDEYKGVTPLKLKLLSKANYKVQYIMDGKPPIEFELKGKVGPKWVVFNSLSTAVIGGAPIPVVIDAVTGAWYQLDKYSMPFNLIDVNFETGKADLLPASFKTLNKLANYLEKNPQTNLEISGHTDNTGSDEFNLKLSDNRAKSVKKYLIKIGIAESRLSAKGFGESKPVATNDTPEGKFKNRRVEFKFVK